MRTSDHFKLASINQLHPATLKHFYQGHPWITADRFSMNFPIKAGGLLLKSESTKVQCLFLHDPTHPLIKARKWELPDLGIIQDLKPGEIKHHQLVEWLKTSWLKAWGNWLQHIAPQWQQQERNHGIIINAHQSLLPGLQLTYLSGHLLLQTTAYYWKPWLPMLLSFLPETKNILKEHNGYPIHSLWWQQRTPIRHEQKPAQCLWMNQQALTPIPTLNVVLKEGLFQAQALLGQRYDHGFYSDMSTIRSQEPFTLQPFWKGKRFLNLFAYSGAFSLLALKHGAVHTTSLDQCPFAQSLCEKNLQLNNLDSASQHRWLKKDIFAGLEQLIQEGQKFDIILCDPPTSFTGQGKIQKTIKVYPQLIDYICKLLAPSGHIFLFQNTLGNGHQAFQQLVSQESQKRKLKQKKHWRLSNECSPQKGFPESDYLHGHWLTTL